MKSNTKVFKLTPMSGKLTTISKPTAKLADWGTPVEFTMLSGEDFIQLIVRPDYDKLTRDPRAWDIQAKAIIHQLSQRKDASKL